MRGMEFEAQRHSLEQIGRPLVVSFVYRHGGASHAPDDNVVSRACVVPS